VTSWLQFKPLLSNAATCAATPWAKMMKDCKVFDKKFTSTSADIIFSKAKPKVGLYELNPVDP
jgi:hypothetical protein